MIKKELSTSISAASRGNWHLNDKYVGTLTNPGTIALPRQYIHGMHLNESLRSKVCTLNDKNEICMHMSDRIKHVGTQTTALDGGGEAC